jgi:CxxC motif-containing protein
MEEIKAIKLKAPVRIGDVVIKNVAGLPCNIIATRNILQWEG